MQSRASTLSVNVIRGQVGVYRVAAELLRRHLIPYFPAVDVGIDIVVNGSVRVQVKSTLRAIQNKWRKSHYQFTLHRAEHFRRNRVVPSASRVFSRECDFVVCHAIEDNRFWVIPSFVLDGRSSVLFNTEQRSQWKPFDVDVAMSLRLQGMANAEIAKHVGVSTETVRRRLESANPKRPYADVPQYENQWDLIAGALATLNEANAAVTVVASPEQRTVADEQLT